MDLVESWAPRRVVVDATGLGAGVASFLQQRYGPRVSPYVFSAQSKSQLGWAFLAICDTARFKDHARDGSEAQEAFWRQALAAAYEILDGPGRRLRWGVGQAGAHDDLLVSAALCAALEREPWAAGESAVVGAADPLGEIDGGQF